MVFSSFNNNYLKLQFSSQFQFLSSFEQQSSITISHNPVQQSSITHPAHHPTINIT